ncbi:MAG TPA: MFS transporter [Anaerolineales bacterium]|nr:MFS transporter [Anaerolineales bacterium]
MPMDLTTRIQLIVVTALRIILNTLHRMAYPFLSIFAGGLGVDLTTVSLILTGRNLAGALSPFLAPLADQRGRRLAMLAGAGTFALGASAVAIHPSLLTLSIALILGILSKDLFDPAIQAYFGDRVSYEQRGTALAITEMSWSLAFIAGVPLAGLLIARFGWSAPFPVFAVLGIGMFAVIWWMIPHTDAHYQPNLNSRAHWHMILASIPALACAFIALWSSAANEMVNLIFGVWLSDSFGLQIAALAGASAVIGFAELSGEGLVALVTDRIGKPRAVAIGLAGNVIASILLPFIGRTETGALIGLFLFYISFEYMIVSQLPMMTEAVPQARATAMALNLIGFSIGRALGALLSTIIYQDFGFLAVTWAAAGFNILAGLALAEMQRKIVILPHILEWTRRILSSGD